MNGACYKLTSNLTVSAQLQPGYRDCQKADVDLCFLVDGSSGMGEREFAAIREFMISTMRSHNSSNINFAAVQFSNKAEVAFTFARFQTSRDPKNLLDSLEKKGGLTSAYSAIRVALEQVFIESAGSRPNAKKVILMLTDGEVTDNENGVIERSESIKLSRYIIGIGKNFNNEESKKNLHLLASKPTENYTRVLDDVSKLKDVFSEIERKIVSVEGVTSSSNFPREFSSAGLSADMLQGTLVLGDPGIYEWSGGILETLHGQDTLINTSMGQERHFSYLGYSVRLIYSSEGLFCVSGAPRYNYKGQVILLKKNMATTGWEEIKRLHGEQFGSYFGSEIAVSDFNNESPPQLVLISAPHHVEKRWGGQVSVCLFRKGDLSCTATLRGESGHPFAQFGAAVTFLSDLDGDGIQEVAVGAPYEMDGTGALYIFKGEQTGVQTMYSQRLLGTRPMQSFGLSVHGVLDMTSDGLTDLVVGSLGQVGVHRSYPVIHVTANMTFKPPEIPIPKFDVSSCESALLAQTCVHSRILTRSYTGSLDLVLHFLVVLDSGRSVSRISFENQQRELNETFRVQREGKECRDITLYLSDCSLDDLSPIAVSLSVHKEDSFWLLSPSSSLTAVSQILFQICENGGICGSDLSVTFKNTSDPRFPVPTLLLRSKSPFSVSLELKNMGEVGHQITLALTHPHGLSFHKAAIEVP
ncbi:integrin alpha-L [Pelobates cultripes]|uniref:Integrin alpha-L n=1 Tax=Pelobates cultripes TaxID=61616 RepID=A0AAD1WJR6_PELCU|nr:integrin alpha-L [Pelobates cultripes]